MPTSKRLNVAVVGATGLVGTEMLKILAQRKFPADKVRVFASERSVGKQVPFNGHTLKLERLEENIGAAAIELTPADLGEIEDAASRITVQGARYPEQFERMSGL